RGDLYPEEKARVIEKDTAITVMVGDGLNDAQAIAASNVGVGVSGGIEATLEVADVFVSGQGLRGFWRAYEGACSTKLVVQRNLKYSIVYNLLGASLAVLGYITPLIAALIMPISSCTVILSSIVGNSFKSRGSN
ncbi:MAG: heavy metal translocating P-type ATPase, partial [Deltaproteobacteria bacterium]|nr:heavy metal translocating P-type ATPase [Deltaproteobacteria bacterium]